MCLNCCSWKIDAYLANCHLLELVQKLTVPLISKSQVETQQQAKPETNKKMK